MLRSTGLGTIVVHAWLEPRTRHHAVLTAKIASSPMLTSSAVPIGPGAPLSIVLGTSESKSPTHVDAVDYPVPAASAAF